jgi:hypothetical protein
MSKSTKRSDAAKKGWVNMSPEMREKVSACRKAAFAERMAEGVGLHTFRTYGDKWRAQQSVKMAQAWAEKHDEICANQSKAVKDAWANPEKRAARLLKINITKASKQGITLEEYLTLKETEYARRKAVRKQK